MSHNISLTACESPCSKYTPEDVYGDRAFSGTPYLPSFAGQMTLKYAKQALKHTFSSKSEINDDYLMTFEGKCYR